MKTKIISTLKRELLIVEPPERYDLEWMNDEKYIRAIIDSRNYIEERLGNPPVSYTLLGSPDEIKEDDARELVETGDADPVGDRFVLGYRSYFDDYENDVPQFTCETATESLLSALESEIYWENPISKQLGFTGNVSETDKQIALQKQKRRFDEAQEKTFDRNRSIILVKN